MDFIKNFARIDQKFAWSFLGFLLAVFFGGLTVYDRFIKDNNPSLSIEILSNTNVLDLKENLPELKILYGNVDIKKLNKTLSVVILRVHNNGTTSILNSYYDEKSPLALTLPVGSFVKVEKISATNDYLSQFAKLNLVRKNLLHFSNVIMESGESYTLKALILHDSKFNLSFKASGKIAGIRNINTVIQIDPKERKTFLSEAFSGGILIQFSRILFYLTIVIFSLMFIVIVFSFITRKFETYSRLNLLKKFKLLRKKPMVFNSEIIFDTYINSGIGTLENVLKLILNDKKLLKEILKNFPKGSERLSQIKLLGYPVDIMSADDFFSGSSPISVSEIKAIPLIYQFDLASITENDELKINDEVQEFFIDFMGYIHSKI